MVANSIEALPFNLLAFSKLAAGPNAHSSAVSVATYIGEFAPYLVLGLFGIAWLAGGKDRRRIVFIAVATATLGLILNVLIASGFPQPRPFEMGLGQNLLNHAPEASFPSDHATLVWSLGFGLIAAGGNVPLAAIVVGFGFAVAWARIFLGAHFPLDMIGSMAVAITSAAIAGFGGSWLYGVTYRPIAAHLGLLVRSDR